MVMMIGRKIAGAAIPLVALLLAWVEPASATIRNGDIQISGNLESQQLVRLDSSPSSQFSAFDVIQQRNTFRLQYEHQLVKGGSLLGLAALPFVTEANLFSYYRFVYDSVYDIAPGSRLRVNDGSIGGSFEGIAPRDRGEIAFENVLREIFLDVKTASPLSLRIGRQQIIWGNTLNFRALDSVNALDLTWHLQQEAGLLGKVGFSELRIPAFAVKALYNVGSVGPFSNVFVEAYDIPFDFNPTKLRFSPAPFSVNLRNPFRSGLVLDLGTASGNPPTGVLAQPCFDFTGNAAPNGAANPNFSRTADTGICNSAGLTASRLGQGLYGRRDPADVNQVGARVNGTTPQGIGLTFNYLYRRHLADATGGTIAKAQVGAVNANPTGFFEQAPHETTDPLTGRTSPAFNPATGGVAGFLRIPVEIYYPYVSVFGLAADYFDDFTATVYNLEVAATRGVPIATADPTGNGIRRTDVIEAALLLDRPTWIPFLNPRATWTILAQANVSYLPDHEALRLGPNGQPIDGDLGAVNSTTIPGQFRDEVSLDERKQFEPLTVLALTSFYRGGSIAPLFAWVSDWNNAPAMEFQFIFEVLPTPNLIIDPGVRVFWTDGRTVDDRFQIGSLSGRSELQLKITYQF